MRLPSAGSCHVEQVCRSAGDRRQVKQRLHGKLALPDRQRGRAAEQGRRRLRQPVEAQRLQVDLAVEADDPDLREGDRAAPLSGRSAECRPW
jgi:hypothetical protein